MCVCVCVCVCVILNPQWILCQLAGVVWAVDLPINGLPTLGFGRIIKIQALIQSFLSLVFAF